MNVRLHRRASFEIRRDAATVMSNGRVRYDALFSRWGMQSYPDGVEFRPEDEVFAAASMASGELCPGVLLHPEQNFGTDFGGGVRHLPRGTSGDIIARADDGIHTAGTLMVWDEEWNALIASQEVAELSVGFTIEPDPTPGVAPEGAPGSDELGLDYVLVHRDIVWDHIAGVPEGNAGSARVVTDARSSSILPVTRRVLADIARGRADSRTYYHDLGSWPRRDKPQETKMDKQKLLLARLAGISRLDAKAFHDAWVDIYGESNDPDMKAALAALAQDDGPAATPAATTPAPAPVADAEEEEEEPKPPAESEGESEGESEEEPAPKPTEEEEEKMAADADDRADALEVARLLFGRSFTGRTDGKTPKRRTTLDIKRECVAKFDASLIEDMARLDAKQKPVAIELGFAKAKRVIADEQISAPVDALIAAINSSRQDRAAKEDAGLAKLAKRIKDVADDAANTSFGQTPAAAPAQQ